MIYTHADKEQSLLAVNMMEYEMPSGPRLNIKTYLRMAISMLKIRRPLGRLIFNMGIAIPGKTVFLIETAPCVPILCCIWLLKFHNNLWNTIDYFE